MVLVNLTIDSFIRASYSLMEVAPVVMTCMATGYELLLESTSEVNDLKHLIGLSSLGTLSEARVIMVSCLRCYCSFGKVNVKVEGMAEKVFALLWVVMPKVPPLEAMMFLFLALVVGTA
ncbi:hypothetical protein ACFX2I_018966 [Malus domestica]